MTATRRARPRTALDPARRTAFAALCAVEIEDAYLNLVLPGLLDEAGLTGRDAAFATELANATARLRGRYDAILDVCVAAGARSLQPEVLAALRLGAHQLLGMRVPAHAAVATTVELIREAAGERPVRLANAVLRRIAARTLEAWLADMGSLAQRASHPQWIVDAFGAALSAEHRETELEALLEADNVAPPVALAVRPGLGDLADLVAGGAAPGRLSPYAAVLQAGNPSDIAAVRAGTAGVQDEGSQLAALALARAPLDGPDRLWLDMCAGPGGKSALLTGLARSRGAHLVSGERLPHRAGLVLRALRAYPQPVAVLAADGTRPPWPAATFDRILVDAPCTGLGALRRRPEARWRRTPEDLETLVSLQRRLLESAIDSVRPGGVVGYVTCSPHLAETRGVVEAVLAIRDDATQEEARGLLPEAPDAGPGPHVQLWPHRHGTDAMFVAVLRRQRRRQ
jgi:16S rRNA (cytosine967-C5)-methyltransferase